MAKIFICEICVYETEDIYNIIMHYKLKHKQQDGKVVCALCKNLYIEKGLLDHIKGGKCKTYQMTIEEKNYINIRCNNKEKNKKILEQREFEKDYELR